MIRNGLNPCEKWGMIIFAVVGLGLAIFLMAWLPDALALEDADALDSGVEWHSSFENSRFTPKTGASGESYDITELNVVTYNDFDYACRDDKASYFRENYGKLISDNVWALFAAGAASLGISLSAAQYVSYKESGQIASDCGSHGRPVSNNAEALSTYKKFAFVLGLIVLPTLFGSFSYNYACMQATQVTGMVLLGASALMNVWLLYNVVNEYVIHPYDWEEAKKKDARVLASNRVLAQNASIKRFELYGHPIQKLKENARKANAEWVEAKLANGEEWTKNLDKSNFKPTEVTNPYDLFGTGDKEYLEPEPKYEDGWVVGESSSEVCGCFQWKSCMDKK